jgi:hypothetical protein
MKRRAARDSRGPLSFCPPIRQRSCPDGTGGTAGIEHLWAATGEWGKRCPGGRGLVPGLRHRNDPFRCGWLRIWVCARLHVSSHSSDPILSPWYCGAAWRKQESGNSGEFFSEFSDRLGRVPQAITR